MYAYFSVALGLAYINGYAFYIPNHVVGLFLYRISYICVVLTVYFTTGFIQDLIGIYDRPASVLGRRILKIVAGILSLFHLTPLVINDFARSAVDPNIFRAIPGPLYSLSHLFIAVTLVALAAMVLLHVKEMTGVRRNQLRFLAFAIFLGVVGVAMRVHSFLTVDRPLTYFIPLMSVNICLSYLISQHELLEFNFFMKILPIYAGVYSVLIGIPFLIFSTFDPSQHTVLSLALLTVGYGLLCSLAPTITAFLRHRMEGRRYVELEKKNQELLDLDAMKKTLISNITHEFKSPLAIVDNAVGVLLGENGPKKITSAKKRKLLTMIQENTNRLGGFIQNLLNVAKIEKSKVELHRERVNVDELLREAIRAVKPLAEIKKIRIEDKILGQVSVEIDREKILQVFINLLSNAVKFTSKGGVTVSMISGDNGFRVQIKDTGMGIEPVYLRSVFDSFFRSPAANKADRKGTGLGLAIVRGWTEAHGGRVWAESDGPGYGSTFIVELPA